jgi:hypothetical protein
MPREFAKIQFGMFTDSEFAKLSIFDKSLYIALLAQPSLNYAGIQPLNAPRLGRALCDAGRSATVDEIYLGLSELQSARYVFTDEITGECLIRTFIRNDGIDKQPRLLLSALRAAAAVESPKLAGVLLTELEQITLPAVIRTGRPSAEKLEHTLKVLFTDAISYLEAASAPAPHAPARARDVTRATPARAPATREVVVGVEVASPPTDITLGGLRACAHEPAPEDLTDPSIAPPPYCKRHMPNGTDEDCGACMGARHRRTEWLTQKSAETSETARNQAIANRDNQRGLRLAAIQHCPLCDDDGYRPNRTVCDHIDRTQTHRNGAAMRRAALTKKPQPL